MSQEVEAAEPKKKVNKLSNILNSFGDFITNLTGNNILGNGAQVSNSDTLFYNLRWYPISNNRQLLSQIYFELGVVQTLVDQPVDDAFRAGFEIKTKQLNGEDLEMLEIFLEQKRIIANLMQAVKWARLFGGGAILIINNDKPDVPLDITKLKEDEQIEFRAVDMWELYPDTIPAMGDPKVNEVDGFYSYYGKRVHPSRVYAIKGKEPPSFIKPRLRGWGMSEVERAVRPLNQYLKNEDVVFELLDEAKIDVYGIQDLNSALSKKGGSDKITQRVMMSNVLKNYQSAIIMDKEDSYEQKQLTFSGLADILNEIRQGLAAALKMPLTKLFGISAAGFNSGEDDIENYNSMVEGEVRAKVKFIVVDMCKIACQLKFGIIPEDLMIKFKPLRVLGAKEEEDVKTQQFNRLISSFQSGTIDGEDFKSGLNKAALLPVEIDPAAPVQKPIDDNFVVPTKKVQG